MNWKFWPVGLLFVVSGLASSAPLQSIGTFCGTFPDQCKKGTISLLAAKGTTDNIEYIVEVNPVTGEIPVTGGGGGGGTVQGMGTAGTPSGGVLSVQGVAGGTPIPISGTVTATNASVSTTGTAVPASATMVAGTDGTNLRALSVNSSGVLTLPTGASTSALQTTGNTSLSSISSNTSVIAANSSVANASLSSIDGKLTGVSTAANQSTELTFLSNILVTASDIDSKLGTLGQKTMAGSAPVVIASDQSSIPITAASLPLPTGASTSANQVTTNASLSSITSNTAVTAGSTATPGLGVPGTGIMITGSDAGTARFFKLSSTGVLSVDGSSVTQPVSIASLPLPTGAATSALQTSGNSSLSSINSTLSSIAAQQASDSLTLSSIDSSTASLDSKTNNNYGAATGAIRTASQIGNTTGAAAFGAGTTSAQTLRVVLPTDQSAIPVSGTVTATNPSVSTTGTAVPASATMIAGSDGTNLRAVLVSATGVVSVDGSGVTQPVSGTVTANLGTIAGVSTAANQATEIASLSSIDTKLTSPLAITAASLPLPAGAATSALQTTGNTSLASIDTKLTSPLTVTGTVAATPPDVAYADSARNVYSSTNVTTGAWVQLIASTAATIHYLTLFDSCGQTLELGTGAAASETRKLIIPPGGIDGQFKLTIASGTRVSIRAISATCSTGEIDITGFN